MVICSSLQQNVNLILNKIDIFCLAAFNHGTSEKARWDLTKNREILSRMWSTAQRWKNTYGLDADFLYG